jgi:hypothetical protein
VVWANPLVVQSRWWFGQTRWWFKAVGGLGKPVGGSKPWWFRQTRWWFKAVGGLGKPVGGSQPLVVWANPLVVQSRWWFGPSGQARKNFSLGRNHIQKCTTLPSFLQFYKILFEFESKDV